MLPDVADARKQDVDENLHPAGRGFLLVGFGGWGGGVGVWLDMAHELAYTSRHVCMQGCICTLCETTCEWLYVCMRACMYRYDRLSMSVYECMYLCIYAPIARRGGSVYIHKHTIV